MMTTRHANRIRYSIEAVASNRGVDLDDSEQLVRLLKRARRSGPADGMAAERTLRHYLAHAPSSFRGRARANIVDFLGRST